MNDCRHGHGVKRPPQNLVGILSLLHSFQKEQCSTSIKRYKVDFGPKLQKAQGGAVIRTLLHAFNRGTNRETNRGETAKASVRSREGGLVSSTERSWVCVAGNHCINPVPTHDDVAHGIDGGYRRAHMRCTPRPRPHLNPFLLLQRLLHHAHLVVRLEAVLLLKKKCCQRTRARHERAKLAT